MKDCTVIICTCDDYEDVWELFFCSFRDNWNDCESNLILNTESKKTDIHGVGVHNSEYLKGNDSWGERFINTLNSISTKYVVALYDDYVLNGKVDANEVSSCINRMEKNKDIAAFYFTTCSPHFIDDGKFSKFDKITKRADYKLNSAPALWNRRKLLSYLKKDDTPWAWEYFGSYRAYKTNDLFYQVKENMDNVYPSIPEGGAIYRGKWQEKYVKPLVKKYNLNLDLTKRGCTSPNAKNNKRSLKWKIDFFRKGFDMIGVAVIIFIFRVIKGKLMK